MLILWQKYMYLIISSVNHIDFWLYYLYYIENVFVEKKAIELNSSEIFKLYKSVES